MHFILFNHFKYIYLFILCCILSLNSVSLFLCTSLCVRALFAYELSRPVSLFVYVTVCVCSLYVCE